MSGAAYHAGGRTDGSAPAGAQGGAIGPVRETPRHLEGDTASSRKHEVCMGVFRPTPAWGGVGEAVGSQEGVDLQGCGRALKCRSPCSRATGNTRKRGPSASPPPYIGGLVG